MANDVFVKGDRFRATVRVTLQTSTGTPGVVRSLVGGDRYTIEPWSVASVVNGQTIAGEINRELRRRGEHGRLTVDSAKLGAVDLRKVPSSDLVGGAVEIEVAGFVSDNLAPLAWAIVVVVVAFAVATVIDELSGINVLEQVTTSISRVGSSIAGATAGAIAPAAAVVGIVLGLVWLLTRRR